MQDDPSAALALQLHSCGSAGWLWFFRALYLLNLRFYEVYVPIHVTARAALVAEVPPWVDTLQRHTSSMTIPGDGGSFFSEAPLNSAR